MPDLASNTFSASGEGVIERHIQVEADQTADRLNSHQEFEDYYEIDRTVDEIVKGDYQRVALQFPDELLHHSVPIFRALKSKIGDRSQLYVLADTSYGSCCVDEVAAQHVEADAMVHYGYACMSQTYRLPVIYVFGKKPIDIGHCVSEFTKALKDREPSAETRIILRHDVSYTYCITDVLEKLKSTLDTPIIYSEVSLRLDPPSTKTETDGIKGVNVPEEHSKENTVILYIGGESLGLTNLLMTHSTSEIHSYNPTNRTHRLESSRTNKFLMRRYAVVQRARDADIFGILIGTLGVASYLPLISHIRKILSKGRKKSYTISVGKLNPAKLANFAEVECFVLVACPENSLIDTKDFYRPIITPYELEVALQAESSWTGRYVLDFEELLAHSRESNGRADHPNDSEEDPDQPIFSTITGKYRQRKQYGSTNSDGVVPEEGSTAMIIRNQDHALSQLTDHAAGQFLHNRSYQGLDRRIGQDAPSLLEQGRSGIARGYRDDHS